MIFLLGASGYVGKAFQRELERRNLPFQSISRSTLDYSNFRVLCAALKEQRPRLVIHAAGFTGKPNVDACESQRAETIMGNVVLAQTVAEACETTGTRLGCVSSGCIYNGAMFLSPNGDWREEEDLNSAELQPKLASRSTDVRGFSENDPANFTFGQDNCSFYSGTKAVAEKMLLNFPQTYVWRLRIPFDEQDSPRNYLSKIQRYSKVYQNWNSISHLGDFASACLQTWQLGLEGGPYNVVNPGYYSTREIVELIQKNLRPDWHPLFWRDDKEFYQVAKAYRSNCLLDSSKLIQSGVKIRPIEEALMEALKLWRPAS